MNGTTQNTFQSLRGFGVGWSRDGRYYQGQLALFQSLRGFGVGWSDRDKAKLGPEILVSIPERVWGGLERLFCGGKSQFFEFQSLRGFGVGWSE